MSTVLDKQTDKVHIISVFGLLFVHRTVRLPDDSGLPDITAFGEHTHVAQS